MMEVVVAGSIPSFVQVQNISSVLTKTVSGNFIPGSVGDLVELDIGRRLLAVVAGMVTRVVVSKVVVIHTNLVAVNSRVEVAR